MIDLKEMESAQQSAQRFNEAVAKAARVSFERGYTDGFADGYKRGQKDARPERKTGKWIERKHGYWSFVNDKGKRDGWIPSYECSECRSGGWRNPEVMNFCPSCGADMRGEQDE